MKTIALFGEIVRDTWPIIVVVFCGAIWLLLELNAPKTVRLDAKHWECTMAVPDGISTRCTEYNYRGK